MRWHIAHADGREWTPADFDAAVKSSRERCAWEPYDVGCDDFCVNGFGLVYLVDEEGMAWSLNGRRDDAEVVWDG